MDIETKKKNPGCKIIALYLPQFHRIKENDNWWGDGYTEWNSVKAAKKFNKYSYQPRIPLDGYYDLAQPDVLKHQARLARKFMIDGFCFYHYYSNGQLLLETPAKNLLQNKDIEIEFIFSWANHDWKRTWYSYNNEILRKQLYGTPSQIVEHFNFLLPYFLDERYIKIDNCPVFAIYDTAVISNLGEYIYIWNELARENGFAGIFFINTIGNTTKRDKGLCDATFDFEPNLTINKLNVTLFSKIFLSIPRMCRRIYNKTFICSEKRIVTQFNYKKIVSLLLARKNRRHEFYGVFVNWDNTPRHSFNGTIYKKFSLDVFKRMVFFQLRKSISLGNELLFINAWNEWSEGAYLEPDDRYQYGYLECVRDAKIMALKTNLES